MEARGSIVPEAWASGGDEVVAALGTDPASGLGHREASARLLAHGANVLRAARQRSIWNILLSQFKSLLVALLGAAVIAAFAFGEWLEAGSILAVLFINALLGFVTELKASRSMEALRTMGAANATVRRDGQAVVVPAAELVPGDIVLLEGGDLVAADLRILEASKLQADESTLTGESVPTSKSAHAVPAEASIGERRSMLFNGTIVTRGSATAIVVATGMDTELGSISRLVDAAEQEVTPLEKRLHRLGRGLVWVTLAIATLVAASGYAAGLPLFLIIETAIALAVAAVPEGLPIIATIALARGMYRMAAHNALVNRLSAVETLGATSIICTDKTGTLTENRMRVAEVLAHGAGGDAGRRRALELCVLCNNASLASDTADGVGDPMEVALLAAGADEGILRAALLREAPEQLEVAFDPDLKMMATIHGVSGPFRVAVKGAPEAVLAVSTLEPEERAHWLAESERLAKDGRRVLAVAEGRVPSPTHEVYRDLDFAGLVALFDPPRVGVRDTIETCRRAGMRIVMVTGDHPGTARNIARATGLLTPGQDEDVILGSEIEAPSLLSEAARSRLTNATIFARVSPRQKLDLIALHQSAGAIVAMTGDGVNDAPALRKADIGVAMGERGTAAAREAAAMVLRDDDLSTLEIAIAEGRTIFDNIRSFVVYLLSCNLSEVLVVAIAAAAHLPLPLLPLQLLFLNLLTDVFPALALGVGEASDDVMRRPPRAATEPVVTARHWRAIVGHGALMTASVLTAFAIALRDPAVSSRGAVTVAFATLAFTQLWHVFDMRRGGSGLLRNEVTRNPWVWGALALCTAMLLAAIYTPPIATALAVEPPSGPTWLLILGMSVVPLIAAQGARVARRFARGEHSIET